MTEPQTSKPLSTRTIETMKPKDKDKPDVGENRGLRVRCGATGVKTFYYRYTSPLTKKLSQVKIGHFPQVSLAEARIRLQELKQIRQQGRCPATEQANAKTAEKDAGKILVKDEGFTVKSLIELYLTQYIEDRRDAKGKRIPGARKPKGQEEVRRTLYSDAVPNLGSKVARELTRRDVVDLIMSIVERGANVQAGNVLRELTAAYEFAIGLGYFPDDFANPALLAKSNLKQAKIRLTPQKGKRVLSDNELSRLLNWLPSASYTQTQKNVIRLTLWTGCRTGEVCDASWSNIDLEKGVFHIKETKNNVERYVQLPDQAVEFLKSLRLSTGEYPFPSQKTGKPIQQKQLTEQAWRMRRDKTMLDIEPWTPHDLRRTVRTGLARLKCPSDVAEAILGHSKSGIEGTYNLHSYEDECRDWLQRWADHLDALTWK